MTKKHLWVIIGMLAIIWLYGEIKINFNSSNSEYSNDTTVNDYNSNSSQTAYNEIEYSGNRCDECGKECKRSLELHSSGDAMSNYRPYYLCGDQECTNNRYEKDLKMQRIERQEEIYRKNERMNDPAGEVSRDKLSDWMDKLNE